MKKTYIKKQNKTTIGKKIYILNEKKKQTNNNNNNKGERRGKRKI